jgi:hypothetical protein
MKVGSRKMILGLVCAVIICLIALITRDVSIVLAGGGMLTSLMATIIYGYNAEYKNQNMKGA